MSEIKTGLIDTGKIIDLLEQQFVAVMSKDVDYYSNYKVILDVEQMFIKNESRAPGNIYIVVKFAQANINLSQVILPITLNVISERNNIDACQRLLFEYSQEYNLKVTDIEDQEREINYTINQFYSSPSNSSNFNEVYVGFRSVFYLSGTFLISQNANPFDVYLLADENDTDGEKIPCISNNLNFTVKLDSQPYYNTENFTESVAQYGTLALGITSYFVTSGDSTSPNLFDKLLYIMAKKRNDQDALVMADGVNTTFIFKLVYKNGTELILKMKLADFTHQSTIGQMPIVSITFTC